MRGKVIALWAISAFLRIIPAGAGKSRHPRRHCRRPWDHPRGCGEKWPPWPWGPRWWGSSPRVRGKVTRAGGEAAGVRIIPAGAGKRESMEILPSNYQDHPRGCGEKASCVVSGVAVSGSSPRVRGKALGRGRDGGALGIIPAGAGKRSAKKRVAVDALNHPRGCGEKMAPHGALGCLAGSSPRVRGKALPPRRQPPFCRIIPAGAGKSRRMRRTAPSLPDHPRGCGEKVPAWVQQAACLGSSPRVRGKVLWCAVRDLLRGIIPAGAGKRTAPERPRPRKRDHPRGCGEKPAGSGWAWWAWGSSPRVRGKGAQARLRRGRRRIIPAGAGKSSAGVGVWWCGRDHPRGCGEKRQMGARGRDWRGSSPRVRGKVKCGHVERVVVGIIPAGAGKSRHPRRHCRRPWDHPRGCGEKTWRSPPTRPWPGSSPRVRGKDGRIHAHARGEGIIPAGAGKRRPSRMATCSPRDHPRGCGEKTTTTRAKPAARGSSPRVRGKGRLLGWVTV